MEGGGIMPNDFKDKDDEIERTILEIWSSVLQVDSMGANDDFYDLGGDSLAAMLCISRIRAKYGVELTIEDFLLPGATISQIAAEIRQSGAL
jgi:acyl carrier protein